MDGTGDGADEETDVRGAGAVRPGTKKPPHEGAVQVQGKWWAAGPGAQAAAMSWVRTMRSRDSTLTQVALSSASKSAPAESPSASS